MRNAELGFFSEWGPGTVFCICSTGAIVVGCPFLTPPMTLMWFQPTIHWPWAASAIRWAIRVVWYLLYKHYRIMTVFSYEMLSLLSFVWWFLYTLFAESLASKKFRAVGFTKWFRWFNFGYLICSPLWCVQ